MSEEVNRGGRPVGTGDDPNRLSRAQVIADAKLYRSMAEDLKTWYAANKNDITLEDRLKCLNFLRQAVIEGLKFHLAPAKAASPVATDEGSFNVAEVYKEMLG